MNPCGQVLSPSQLRACMSQSLSVAGAVSKSEGGKDGDSIASWWVLGRAVDTSRIGRLLAGNCGGGSHSAIAHRESWARVQNLGVSQAGVYHDVLERKESGIVG